MSDLRYLSLFSGIGGLEHPRLSPLMFCEADAACRDVLRHRHPGAEVHEDVLTLLDPPPAEMVVGGWPCQDLSSAGRLGGINAERSGLFFAMLRITANSGARTLVGENVPNLLTINRGGDFRVVLDALASAGFPFVAWRILNARAFGLPQERRRLFIVASKDRESAEALHASIPPTHAQPRSAITSGFYWTGGKRSICFSRGYVPALKIGATDNKGRAPVAILVHGRARKLSAAEFLRLQGFENLPGPALAPSTLLRMAGNAVPAPMGQFVVSSVASKAKATGRRAGWGIIGAAGMIDDGMIWEIDHPASVLSTNLVDFVDTSATETLSGQAAAGLIVRSVRSGHLMPRELYEVLAKLAANRSEKLHPSRGNSFEALDSMSDAVAAYQVSLPAVSQYTTYSYDEDDFDENDQSSDDIDG